MEKNKETELHLANIEVTLREISNTLIRQEEQLGYHIRRTDLLEGRVKPLETAIYTLMGGVTVTGVLLTILKLLGTF